MSYTNGLDKPTDYFNTKLYTGNAVDGSGTTQSVTGVGFQPDWVWIKSRSATKSHYFFDVIRGATKQLNTNNNNTENTGTTSLTAFGSDGFTLGSEPEVNEQNTTFVSWNWKESTTAGLDIIAYQGTGSNLDLSHNLSAIPDWIMIKDRSVDQAWRVYSKSMGFSNRLVLSESGAKSTSALGLDADPTSSVINIGTGTGTTNTSGDNYICYAFKNVQGFSRFGSYQGNGSSDGSYIHLGFSPSFIMLKRTDASGDWQLVDNKRLGYNVDNNAIFPNLSNVEDTGDVVDILSNGFKIRSATGTWNASGGSYIYMCFASNPFVTSTGIPTTAR